MLEEMGLCELDLSRGLESFIKSLDLAIPLANTSFFSSWHSLQSQI